MSRSLEVGICGSYGGMNLGDEAILAVIVSELRRRLPAVVTVFSRNPGDTLARHPVERAIPVRELGRAELVREVGRLDLLVIGGGGILFDREAAIFLRPAEVAQRLDVPVITWAVGAGPLGHREERETVRRVLDHARLVTVRDAASRLILEDIGVTCDIQLTADPAFLLDPAPVGDELLAGEGIPLDTPLVGISVREPGPAAPDLDVSHCRALIADVVDFATERLGGIAVFIPMERTDLREAHRVAARLDHPERVRLLTAQYSAAEVRGLISYLALAVGMRLHFLIFAAAARVPLVGLAYSAKVMALLDELGSPMPHVNDAHSGRLLALLDRSWDERERRQHEVGARTQPLIHRAIATAELVATLLRDIGWQRERAGGETHA